MAEKKDDSWPNEPADENISNDPPNRFERDEEDQPPAQEAPDQSEGRHREDTPKSDRERV